MPNLSKEKNTTSSVFDSNLKSCYWKCSTIMKFIFKPTEGPASKEKNLRRTINFFFIIIIINTMTLRMFKI